MGFLSKLWKGVKKAVKGVARAVKKVSKKIITSLPGGDKLWEFGTKIGKGIEKGLAKITSKLGPIGTMALSFVLAPVMGPAISSLWSSFGAGAAAMAGSANAIVAGLGTAGTAVFNGVNFVSGTLGSLGKALSEGVKNVGKGNFGAAGDAFMTNMKAAFSGEAGSAAVSKGIAESTRLNQIKEFKSAFADLPAPDSIVHQKPSFGSDISDFELGMRDSSGNLFNPTSSDIVADPSLLSEPSSFNNVRPPVQVGEGTVLAPSSVPGVPQEMQGLSPEIPATPGEGTVLKEPKSFLEKTTEAVRNASEVANAVTGGGENSGFETSSQDVGRQYTEISASSPVEAIKAAGGGGSLWDRLIAQAGQQARGGFV